MPISKTTGKPRHKFNAKAVMIDKHRFDSKLEAKYNEFLLWLRHCGEVLFFLRQVPFHLPGGVKYVVDFQVFYQDGRIEFVDVKGMETASFKMKKKMVEDLYPIPIKVVRKDDFHMSF